jgi:hypothetical protein
MTTVPMEWKLLDRELREGVPTEGWPGDPRMELVIGQVRTSRAGYDPNVKRWVPAGYPVAQRLEVWRTTENHGYQRIGTWHPNEAPFIIKHLVAMDPSRPNHVSVLDRIDAHNAAMDEENSRAYMQAAGEMAEHLAKLNHDRNEPRNIFRGMPGTRDRKDLKRDDA